MGFSGDKRLLVAAAVTRVASDPHKAGLPMFRGANKVTLDSKGRLAMPTRYRELIAERSGGRLIATVHRTDKCLLIYLLPEWEEVERKIKQLPSMHPATQRLKRLMIGHASDVELDAHGRLLLPPKLREYAALARQSVLIGQINCLELWDEALWNEHLAAELPDEELPPELKSLSL